MADPSSLDIVKTLIRFDTTSRDSNLALIEHVRGYLARLGVDSRLVPSEDGRKANLYATIGPRDRPGVLLSGHTDVVPVDGQDWRTDPFDPVVRDGKLYGRGACDMKSFIGVVLAFVPQFLKRGLSVPIHLALSYDEEVGCVGVRRLIDALGGMEVKPAMCIVGEPSGMQVTIAHKGRRSYNVHVRGMEAHSSLAPRAVNAIEYAALLIAFMRGLARRFAEQGPFDGEFDVDHSTVQTCTIEGGTAVNIVPRDCRFNFEFRNLPRHDADAIVGEIAAYAKGTLEPEMRKIAPESFIRIEEGSSLPGLDTEPGEEVVAFVKALAGRNDHTKVAFGTEAGLFQKRAGIPTVVCGPGDIEQAHKPNEFVTLDQLAKCEAFMARLADRVCGG
jgi:acetylornithine deacetylase